MTDRHSISQRFRQAVDDHETRPCLSFGGVEHSYAEMYSSCQEAVGVLNQLPTDARVGVLGDRSVENYQSMYSVILSGHCFVPMSPNFPVDRLRNMIDQSAPALVVYDSESKETAEMLAIHFPEIIFVLFDELKNFSFPTFESAEKSEQAIEESFQYVLFTSGSTGTPKGVGVTKRNVASYLDNFFELYPYVSTDKVSQTFELTFDLGMHDVFTTWTTGACLVPLKKEDVLFSANFIKQNKLSVWFSVPSVARIMDQIGTIKDDSLQSLRLSMFCGEALTASLASKWKSVAANSRVVNLYGPTEATIAISSYELEDTQKVDSHQGLVSLGTAYPNQQLKLFKKSENSGYEPVETRDGVSGLLCLSGSQVTPGYWNDSKKTDQAFFTYAGQRWYLTGDIAMYRSGSFYYLGRSDSQVQIQGHRVELIELEFALKEVTGSELCIALPLPHKSTVTDKIAAVCSPTELEADEILQSLKNTLPAYMVPDDLHIIENFPTNSNGKVDRSALVDLLGFAE